MERFALTRYISIFCTLLSCALTSCTTTQEAAKTPSPVLQVIYPYKYKGEKCFTRLIENQPIDEICVKKDIVSYNPDPVAFYAQSYEFPDYVRALFASADSQAILARRESTQGAADQPQGGQIATVEASSIPVTGTPPTPPAPHSAL